MGVYGLKTFLEHHCSDACYSADISKMVLKHERKTGERAEIVVDAHSCFSMWYEGLDWTIGIEVQQLIERLRSFVTSFEKLNVDLVFFIGSLTPEKKRSTWLRRRVAIMHKMMNVFDMLNAGRSYKDIPAEWDYIPPNMTNFVAYVLKHVLNCRVHVTVDECDEEIIDYVEANSSFAIFSEDTDFIVSNVDGYVLSVSDFDASKMTTTLYDRDELCEQLNLEKEDLPLLAILAGNDYIRADSLKKFHNLKCGFPAHSQCHIPYKTLFTSLAKYINTLPSYDDTDPEELMEIVCSDVFRSHKKEQKMLRAYNSYFPNDDNDSSSSGSSLTTHWYRVLDVAEDRLRDVLLPVSAWGVLSEQVYECSPCLEDLRVTTDCNEDTREQPSATITRPLRQRLYGILLYEIRDDKPVVTEWCGENEDSYQKPVRVKPVYIQAHHPGLRALWDENRSEIHYENKWILFLRAVSWSKPICNVGAWMDLPSDLVVSTATCYYLYMDEDFLDYDELRIVLATLAIYSAFDCEYLDEIYDGESDLRAINISVTFSRTFSLVFSILASCGYPEPLNKETAHIRFEPKLFQHLYERKQNEPGYDPLYRHWSCRDRYDQMYNTIHG